MKTVLLIGLGRFGFHAAVKLNELDHQVMAIDSDEKRVDRALPFVTNALIGDSTDEDFIKSLGVEDYDLCIVAIGNNFQSSLETTSLLKEAGAKLVVSRAATDMQAKFLAKNGADEVIYPEKQLADWTAMRYTSDHIFDYFELTEGYAIFEVAIPKEWIGKNIGQIDIRKKYGINVLALEKNGTLNMAITTETAFDDGERILVLGTFKNVRKCFKLN
ncbi:MAG: TrkA family potassium uptake protein [Clostridiales bacterium]|nr:TrkA family potassium uptake protein [Clostridiales bacterium]